MSLTLRLRPGDRLTIDLINRLDVGTNLHPHGLGVSPTSPADDVFARIAPGETRRYEYQLRTAHPSGLFRYHPHLHGDVKRQVGDGLVGAIIVEDQIDDLIEISFSHERLWVLNDPSSAERTMTGMDQMHGRAGSEALVNGISQPDLHANLHVWPFQVVDDRGWPGWKDTDNVPGGQQVTIVIPFVGHTGRSVCHCHILDHEDIGMMGVIEVATRPDVAATTESTLSS